MATPPTSSSSLHPRRASSLTALLIGVAFLLFFGYAAAPGIVEFFDDSLEFQLVLPTLGIAHPTGYPLYTLLGALWSRVLFPVGEWAWRVNLFSALCAAAAVALMAAVTQRIILLDRPTTRVQGRGLLRALASSPGWGALAAALAFGLGAVWSASATVAEVYALHNLFVALILLLSLRAVDASPAQRHRRLIVLFAAIGLALAHHRTTVLALPAVALYLLWSLPDLRRPSRRWLLYAAALLAPLLLYLYLPLRATMGVQDLNAAYVNTWQGFRDHVLARRYAAFFGANPLAVERTPREWMGLAVTQTGWIVLALAAIGLLTGLARPGGGRRAWTLIVLAALTNLLFALLYRVGDVEKFLLPVWLCVAVAAGGGVDWLRGALEERPALAVATSALAVLLIAAGWDGRASPAIRRNEWSQQDRALAMAAANFSPGSQVIGLEGEITALRYMQQAHGRAPGVATIVADDESLRRQRLDEAMAAGAPVYLTRELPGIASNYSFGGEGGLVRVWPRGQSETGAPATPLAADFAGGALKLVGYDLSPLQGAAGRTDQLALYWQPQQPLTQTLKISLRLLDSGGAPFQQDAFPLQGVAPTTSWLPGETVRDVWLLPHAAQGMIQVIVYDAASAAEVGRVELPAGP